MDQDKFKQFVERAKKIGLSREENSVIKQSVYDFVSKHPAGPGINVRFGNASSIFLTRFSFVPSMAILLIAVILTGGGVAIGAERSVPGDILYPVKLGVNEEVRGWLKVSDEAKADWEIRRTERRLKEVEDLVEAGDLDEETYEKIEANFDAHAKRVEERVEKFRNKENFHAAASVSLNFETALKAHEKILSKMADREEKTGEKVKPIRAKVKVEVDESTKRRENIDRDIRNKNLDDVEDNDEDESEDRSGDNERDSD